MKLLFLKQLVNKRFKSLLFLYLFLTSLSYSFAYDSYTYIDALCDRQQHPRLLNTIDLDQTYQLNSPTVLISPEGDFDEDGIRDYAFSGIFDLPTTRNRYFILVATLDPLTNRPKAMFYEEFLLPQFLFLPGTTGEGDPKNQAFSVSTCLHCDKGDDFYWDKSKRTFKKIPWSIRVVTTQKIVTEPGEELPNDIIDSALELAGKQAHVVLFVDKLKKKNKKLGTRVRRNEKNPSLYDVIIFEKIAKREKIFDVIEVDIMQKKIMRSRIKKP